MSKRKKEVKEVKKYSGIIKEKVRYESLNPAKVPRVRRELLDMDYLDDLDDDDYRWAAQFMDEYVSAAVHKDDDGNVKPGYLHNTKELAKSVYDANNKRNNDVLGVSKANCLLSHIDMFGESDNKMEANNITDVTLTEKFIIHSVDNSKRMEDMLTKISPLTKEEHDEIYISEREFKRMLSMGTKMPDSMVEFYKKRYGIS